MGGGKFALSKVKFWHVVYKPCLVSLNINRLLIVHMCMDTVVSKVSRANNGSASNRQIEETASPLGTSTLASSSPPSPPPPLPFARAPVEDRSKYEKLFCYGYSDAEEELEGRKSSSLRLDGRNSTVGESDESANNIVAVRVNKSSARLKLTDEDSIGSATDLKNCCSDDETDEQLNRKYFIKLMDFTVFVKK